jgi:predicted Rossmann fold flavoprotein
MTQTFPALVPLTVPRTHFICGLSGVTVEATVELRSATGKKLQSFTNSTLCTHFGLSGPGVLDISRYYMAEAAAAASPQLFINWVPGKKLEEVDAALQDMGKLSPSRFLRDRGMPDRLAEALCREAGVDPTSPGHTLTRDARRGLARQLVETPIPVNGSRGYLFAEVTAGGVPLSELHLDTMESRVCPGLYLCGEICDVDGRIGGFNFQWAWASGFVAGSAAATSTPTR